MHQCLGKRVVKEKKFPHARKPLHGQGKGWWGGAGSYRTSKLDAAIGAWKAKWREFTTEIIANQPL